jgi:hypothetical protein
VGAQESYLIINGFQGIFNLPFPGCTFAQAEIPATLKERVHIHLTSDIPRIPDAVKYASLDKTDIGRAGE